MPFLQYGIIVLEQTYESYREPIFKLQKRAIRIILNQASCSHSLLLVKDLYLLRFSDIFKLKLQTFVYESTILLTPSYFHGYFSLNSAIHNYTTRQSPPWWSLLNWKKYASIWIRLNSTYGDCWKWFVTIHCYVNELDFLLFCFGITLCSCVPIANVLTLLSHYVIAVFTLGQIYFNIR